MSWREEPATEKQLQCIQDMQELSEYPLPEFTGSTKGEASDYISKYIARSHDSSWAIANGYD